MAQITLKSDISGVVWKILAQPGQKLEPGATVLILESMKMEIPVIAEDGGTLISLAVAEGESVTEGQVVSTLDSG